MIRVRADDETIELIARHTRGALARLEVKGERAGRDEGSATVAAGTGEVGRLVDLGIHVVAKAVLVLEETITILAVVVTSAIYVVLLLRMLARKVTVAVVTWPVGI